jgi:uncharacterized integral membrane protein
MTGVSRAKLITALILGATGVIILLQNFGDVETRVLFWRVTMPHVVVLGIVFVAGLILGATLAVIYCFRQIGNSDRRNTVPEERV